MLTLIYVHFLNLAIVYNRVRLVRKKRRTVIPRGKAMKRGELKSYDKTI